MLRPTPDAALPTHAAAFVTQRTPLLAFDELLAWAAGAGPPHAAAPADRAALRAGLAALVARPEVLEALFVATPGLVAALPLWRAAPESARGRKVERALVKYVARMASRTVPFGLFAGTATGDVGADTRLAAPARGARRRHARLDMAYLWALTDALAGDAALRAEVAYEPNASVYPAGDQRRYYAEARQGAKGIAYQLVSVEATAALDAALARARGGATLAQLAAALCAQDPEVSDAEARAYLDALVAAQLLVSTLTPAVTGPEPAAALRAALRAAPAGAPAAAVLDRVAADLAALEAAPLGVAPGRYAAIAAALAPLGVAADPEHTFQVDLVDPGDGLCLGAAVAAEAAQAVAALHLFAGAATGALASFVERFTRRYDARSVPLAEALDPQDGVGYDDEAPPAATPLVADLPRRRAPEPAGPGAVLHTFVLPRLHQALAAGARELVLTPQDLAALRALRARPPHPLPATFDVQCQLLAASPAAVARGAFRLVVQTAAGPPGARITGRFCHADAATRARVARVPRAEAAQRPDVAFAEVVYLPEARIGNVVLRPVLRPHEIVCLGRSGAPPAGQLLAAELWVAVRDGRVRLYAPRLQREVVPRATMAHAPAAYHLPLYRFLLDLAADGVASALRWRWGALRAAPVLPRVVLGRAILARARWSLTAAQLRDIAARDGAAALDAVARLRAALGWPRFVALVDDENELTVDLDNPLCVEALLHDLKPRTEARFVELLTGPEDLCVHGPEGRFVHELFITFTPPAPAPDAAPDAAPAPAPAAPVVPLAPVGPVARTFAPGSEWLYAKLYAAPEAAERVLAEVVLPLVAAARAAGHADGWFFLRYADPDAHLRVRLHGPAAALWGHVLPALHAAAAPLLAAGTLWRVQLDTYEREVERYGGPAGVALAERWFEHDSDAAAAAVAALAGPAAPDRWRGAVAGADALLDDLGFDLAAKLALVRRLGAAFGRELDAPDATAIWLGATYRRERPGLEALFAPGAAAGTDAAAADPMAAARAAFRRRSTATAAVVADLRRAARDGRLTVPLDVLAESYLHMSLNRQLVTNPRAHERVIYDLLARFYEATQARARAAP